MPNLYFRYGVVGSAKSLNLLALAHTYKSQGRSILLLKPRIDSRFSRNSIVSRTGLKARTDYLLTDDTVFLAQGVALHPLENDNPTVDLDKHADCAALLVDEAQFLHPTVVEQLHMITLINRIPVFCYGLKTDFRTRLFPGSQRLLELSDHIEGLSSPCFYCSRGSTQSLRLADGKPTLSGQTVELGGDEAYVPVCSPCYREKTAGIDEADLDTTQFSMH